MPSQNVLRIFISDSCGWRSYERRHLPALPPTEFLLRGAPPMRHLRIPPAVFLLPLVLTLVCAVPAAANGDISKVKHIIVIMQENHSFDNYFGALAYAPESPYHPGQGSCSGDDHACVDGLTCTVNGDGTLSCANSNLEDNGNFVFSFHDPKRCAAPDLDH